MRSLAKCLDRSKAKIPEAEKDFLKESAAKMEARGYQPVEANETAVRGRIADLENDRAGVVNQINTILVERDKLVGKAFKAAKPAEHETVVMVDPRRLMAFYLEQGDPFAGQLQREVKAAGATMPIAVAKIDKAAKGGTSYDVPRLFMERNADVIEFEDGRHRALWASMLAAPEIPVITSRKSLENLAPFITQKVATEATAAKPTTRAERRDETKRALDGKDIKEVLKDVEAYEGVLITPANIYDHIAGVNPGLTKEKIDQMLYDRWKDYGDIQLIANPNAELFTKEQLAGDILVNGGYYMGLVASESADYTTKDLMTALTEADAAGNLLEYVSESGLENTDEIAHEIGRVALNNPTYNEFVNQQLVQINDELADAHAVGDWGKVEYLEPLLNIYQQATDFVRSYQTGAPSPAFGVVQAYKANERPITDKHIRRALLGKAYRRTAYRPTGTGITVEQVQKIFPGQKVTVNENGEIAVKTRSGKGVLIRMVDTIDVDQVAFNIGYGRMDSKNALIVGKYQEGVIEIKRDSEGNWRLAHESYHFMEDVGIISDLDVDVLTRKIEQLHRAGKWTPANPDDVGGAEDRANFVARSLTERDQFETPVKRILNKVADWIDRFVNLFTRTSKGIIRDIETGQIYGNVTDGRPMKKLPRYMAKTDEDKQFEEDHGQAAKDFNKEEPSLINFAWRRVGNYWKTRKEGWRDAKPDTSAAERLLSLPTHYFYKIPVLKKLLDAGLARADEYQHLINQQERLAGGDSFIKMFDTFRKKNKTAYKKIKNYLIGVDDNQNGYGIKKYKEGTVAYWGVIDRNGKRTGTKFTGKDAETNAARAMIATEVNDLIDNYGFTPEMAKMVGHFRAVTNNGFNVLVQNIRNIMARYAAAKRKMPQAAYFDGAKKVMVDLQTALAIMGDLRGSYFPRIRKPGRFTVYAVRKGTNPILKHFDSKTLANDYAAQKMREGYQVDKRRVKKLPEDVFEMAGSVLGLQAHINAALDRAQRAYEAAAKSKLAKVKVDEAATKELRAAMESIELEFAKAISEQVANQIKMRGVRVHMIGRNQATGKDVWKGYEEDPVLAIAKYVRGVAAGEAKRRMSFKMLRAITGTDITWDKFKANYAKKHGNLPKYKDYIEFVQNRRLDEQNQQNAYKDGTTYMGDMLRNDEFIDRFLGQVRGVATLKYLAGRIAAPFVNLTALPTSAVASMNGFGKIPINKAFRYLGKGGNLYYRYSFGKKALNPEEKMIIDHIIDNGWHEAQYNTEALSVLKSKWGRGWDRLIDWSMYLFGLSERINRTTTISGTFMGLRDQRLDQWNAATGEAKQKLFESWMAEAKKISDDAHGVYGKVNRPHYARGPHAAARVAQSFYVFKTFSHNYLNTMYRLGFKNPKALAWMIISPSVLAGAGASVAMPVVSPLVGALMRALGLSGGEDPEEYLYEKIEEHLGDRAGNLARHGVFGATLGIATKGSLAIGVTDLPTNLKDFLGAPYAMVEDIVIGTQHWGRGDPWKGVEKMMPNFIGSIMRGVREWNHGLTTNTNAPVFYGTEPVTLSLTEALVRAASFNPARVATIREKQWNETEVERRFSSMRTDLYAKLKAYFNDPPSKRSNTDWLDLIQEIDTYNRRVELSGFDYIPYITNKSVKSNLRRAFRPTKKEKMRE